MKYLQKLKTVFVPWFPLAVLITALSFIIYVAVQQNYRTSANDPQIQYSQDLVAELQSGQSADDISDTQKIDVSKSLSPFVIVYDNTGAAVKSTVILNNVTPALPDGVLNYIKSHGTESFTWQPQKDIRIAAVAYKYDNGVVLVGRSLLETEKRIHQLDKEVFIGWLGTLALTWIAILITKVPLTRVRTIFSKIKLKRKK